MLLQCLRPESAECPHPLAHLQTVNTTGAQPGTYINRTYVPTNLHVTTVMYISYAYKAFTASHFLHAPRADNAQTYTFAHHLTPATEHLPTYLLPSPLTS